MTTKSPSFGLKNVTISDCNTAIKIGEGHVVAVENSTIDNVTDGIVIEAGGGGYMDGGSIKASRDAVNAMSVYETEIYREISRLSGTTRAALIVDLNEAKQVDNVWLEKVISKAPGLGNLISTILSKGADAASVITFVLSLL